MKFQKVLANIDSPHTQSAYRCPGFPTVHSLACSSVGPGHTLGGWGARNKGVQRATIYSIYI